MGRVDLHIHTSASDGVLSPAEVVRAAVEKGLIAIAITDHDTIDGLDEALAAAAGTGLEVVPGIELSAEHGDQEVHILGYYLDHQDVTLRDKLGLLRRARRERAWKMVGRLAGMGMPVSWELVAQIAGATSAFGRPHIAQALLDAGFVGSMDEAFDRYIGLKGPAYVARYKLSPEEALSVIADAGGVPVLAHPWRREDLVPRLVANGLAGVEAYYPKYSTEESRALAQLAERYGLIATGGSDFHGYGDGAAQLLGQVPLPEGSVERLRALADRRRAEGAD
ncbi:MAG: PHP domain-containing protein [Anaerolineae bacterium]|nr:PHP domain-containing protein [Anaerolineae bacterium]